MCVQHRMGNVYCIFSSALGKPHSPFWVAAFSVVFIAKRGKISLEKIQPATTKDKHLFNAITRIRFYCFDLTDFIFRDA